MWDYPVEDSSLSGSEVYTILVTRMHSVRVQFTKNPCCTFSRCMLCNIKKNENKSENSKKEMVISMN